MRILFSALALYLAFILQITLGPAVAVLGVQPDIVFAALMSVAAFAGFLRGGIYGAGVGFLMDLMFLSPGVYSLQYTLSGVVSGLLATKRVSRYVQPLLTCAPAYFIKETAMLITLALKGSAFDWVSVLQKVLVGALYTAVLSFVFYLLADLADRRLAKPRDDISFDWDKR